MTQMLGPDARSAHANKLTAVTYLLYAAGMYTLLTAFIAIIMNYAMMDDVKGTWLESHFRWQIRTFWFTLIGYSIGLLLIAVYIGIGVLLAVHLWSIYRIVRGGLNLIAKKPMYTKRPARA